MDLDFLSWLTLTNRSWQSLTDGYPSYEDREIRSEQVYIDDIVPLGACPNSGANLFQLNLWRMSLGLKVGTACLEFEECYLTLGQAPPPSLPPRAAAAPPPSPSPSPAGGSVYQGSGNRCSAWYRGACKDPDGMSPPWHGHKNQYRRRVHG